MLEKRATLAESDRWQFRKPAPGCRPLRSFRATYELPPMKGKNVSIRGLASATDAPYEMHDIYGSYTEVIQPGAFSRTLGQSPQVQLLENHGGRSMAYTRAGTLVLAETSDGLEFQATVNPERSDVADMLLALQDGAYDECSFAFSVERQSWSPDYDQRTIKEVNMNRGDVSVCNFGANPSTSVEVETERAQRALARINRAAKEGRAVAPADVSLIAQSLGWFSAIDNIADMAQEQLSEALGIPNPDCEDMMMDPADMPADMQMNGMTLDLARLLLA